MSFLGNYLPLTGGTLTGALSMGNNPFDAGVITANGRFAIASAARFQGPADGVITLTNNAGTDFSRLQFGGTTSSFPALKRSSDGVQVRLADDSGYTTLKASTITASAANMVSNGYILSTGDATVLGAILPNGDGVFRFYNAAFNDFGRIQLGGTTSSFPSIKRSGTAVAFRLADDSADGPITAASLTTTGGGAFTITQANSVSPTNPNRTITISLGGTTYYLAAKTTND